jgi:7-dehydrocholesterol reductase
VLYYWASLVGFFTVQAMCPDLSAAIFSNMPELLGTLNVVALTLCTMLLLKGKLKPEHPGDRHPTRPLLYEFYTGLELHPRILRMDVKQLTNCRIGMMAWQLLILAFYLAGVQRHGFSAATLVNLLLQVGNK